ncbi:MAG: 7-cyano-7-deazaguanine synthase QueC [Deltaproteobacteria bacterium]|nr:7-cyano-7-deazaguanine synthase QueC [Deltaproteobacteria bacterium]
MSLETKEKKAVILLSGGMDSATCLAIAASQGYCCYSLAFDYGQRHSRELEMACKQASAWNVIEHNEICVEISKVGRSSLTADIAVPKTNSQSEIPNTYVPARNAVFMSLGLSWAETLAARHIFIGANQVDYSGYPDCRRDFIEAFEKMANLATRMGTEGRKIRIHAPLLDMDKAAIIEKGIELGVDFANTHSCYDPGPGARACGRCPSCRLRLKGFQKAGIEDPIDYITRDA